MSRTFGDIEAKQEKFEGNPKVVVAEPDITAFKIRNNFDFILIGCDGIFDKVESRECVHLIWQSIQQQSGGSATGLSIVGKAGEDLLPQQKQIDVHKQCGAAVDSIIKACALRKGCDNLTAVIVAFDNFENMIANYCQSDSKFDFIKEDAIEEILLEPIPELDDEVAKLNDPSSYKSLKKDDYVLYLENDELLSEDEEDRQKNKPPLLSANTVTIPDH